MLIRNFFTILLILLTLIGIANGKDTAPKNFQGSDDIKRVLREAYGNYDKEGLSTIKLYNQQNPKKTIQAWKGNFDYSKEAKKLDSQFPWRNKELDLRKAQDAQKFSEIVLSYIFEGWFTKENKNNFDSHFRENNQRTWCSAPWVSDGPGGRTAVHGLLSELPLRPNPVYEVDPNFDFFTNKLSWMERPLGWGVPFFNRPVCESYEDVFGTPKDPHFPPRYQDYKTPEGFVSFKLHFNTMPNWRDYSPFKGAYHWQDFVSETWASKKRRLRDLPLIQIAVSFKDSHPSLKGTRRDADYWVMLVYTFDPNFNNHLVNNNTIPEPLKHMKAMGIQTGFEPQYSMIFPGSKSNHMVLDKNDQEVFIPEGPHTLLNGASDNAFSSCMGCHAADFGKKAQAIQDILGEPIPNTRGFTWKFTFYDAPSYLKVKDQIGVATDFNLHLESAKKRSGRFIKLYCQEHSPDKRCSDGGAFTEPTEFANLMCLPEMVDLQPPGYCDFGQ